MNISKLIKCTSPSYSNRFIPTTKNHVILKSKASILVIESIDLHESTLRLYGHRRKILIGILQGTHTHTQNII